MTPLRQRLRAETAAAHAGLERVMALDDPALTAARYGAALQVLQAIRAGWEPGVEALCPGSTGPQAAWLAADLASLGLDPVPPAPPLPLTTAAEAWGVRYVLEGSALGGRMLLRSLAPLGFTADRGARTFAGRGEATGAAWRGFLVELEQVEDASGVLRGAALAFSALGRFAAAHLPAADPPAVTSAPSHPMRSATN